MKKYILLLSVFCLGLVSCVKENFAGAEADGLVTFTASYTGASQSKTALVGLTPYWTPGEKISIYDGKNNEFTNDLTTTAAPTAQFKGKLEGQGFARKDFLAAAPYNPDYKFSFVGNYVSGMMLPAEQTAVENGYDPAAAPAIAYTSNTNLSFKNAFSLVKFTVISDGVTSVTISGKNNEVLAGNLNVAYSEQELRITATKKETSVTLKGDFKKESVYYISTLPATLKNGLTVTLNGSVQSLSLDFQVALGRSGLVDLGKLSLNPGESQLPDNGEDDEDDEDEGVPSSWTIIGQFCSWADDGALATYDMGSYYKAFDVPAASLSSFKFKNGDVWLGMGGDAVATDKWVTLSQDGAASDIAFSGTATAYDVYLDKELRGFYITEAGNPSPEPIPAPYVGKSVAGNFNTWNASANPMTEEGDYYVVKGLQLASTNLADPTSNGFKFVDSKGADNATWYGVGVDSIELGLWYGTISGDSKNIVINGDATALYDAYISKDMTTFCVVAAGSELPSKEDVVETVGTIYMKPNSNWKEAAARFAAYFFEGGANTWMSMTDADGDGIYECGVPTGMTNVIFVRMNPATTDNIWDDGVKWGQTADLKVPTDDAIYYVMNEGSWEGAGSWVSDPGTSGGNVTPDPGTDPDPTPDPTPDPGTGEEPNHGTGGEEIAACKLTVKVNKTITWYDKYIYSWDGNGELLGTWPGTKLGWVGEEGDYYVYYHHFDKSLNGKTINYIISGDGGQTKDLTVTLNGADTIVVVEQSDLK